MLVFPADLKFDSKKAKTAIGAKSISFATEEEVAQVTGGIQVGGVPPFGNLFDLPVYADQSLLGTTRLFSTPATGAFPSL